MADVINSKEKLTYKINNYDTFTSIVETFDGGCINCTLPGEPKCYVDDLMVVDACPLLATNLINRETISKT